MLWLATPNIAGAVRPLITRQIESLTGRELTIAGGMTVTPSFAPTVVAHQVTLKNASWGSNRPMLAAEVLEIELRLLPLLLHGDIVIDRLILSGASLLIEERADGTLNWASASPEKPKAAEAGTVATPPYLADLKIEKSSIIVHDMAKDISDTIAVDTLSWSAESATAPLRVSAKGTVDDIAVAFAGQVGPIAEILGGSGKTTVDLTGRVQTAVVTAKGTLDLAGRANDLAVTAKGDQVAALGPWLGTTLPALGAYEAKGRLVGTVGAPSLERASARIGSPATVELRATNARVGKIYHFRDAKLPITLKADVLARAGRMLGLNLPPLKPLSGETILVRESKAYALEKIAAKAGTGPAQIGATGTVADLFGKPNAALQVSVTAKSVDALGDLVGQQLGAIGPLRLSAQLSGRAPKLQIANLSLELDKTDVRGGLTVDLDASPTALRGNLASKRLDLQSLVRGLGAGVTDKDKLPLKALRDAELHIRMSADTIVLANATIGPASAQVDLTAGRLALNDVVIKMLGGTIASSVALAEKDGTPGTDPLASVKLRLRADGLDLAKLLKEGATAPGDNLQVDVDVAVDSEGRTLDQVFANLSGEASMFSNGGKIFGSGLNQLVLDINPLRLLRPFWGDTEVVNVGCLAGIANIKQGIAETHVVLASQRMTLVGEGTVNLRNRQIDLTLNPIPKSRLPSAAGVPVRVVGPLDSPAVDPIATKAVGGLIKGAFRSLASPLNRIAGVFGEKARDVCASAVRD